MVILYSGCFFDIDASEILRQHRAGRELEKSIESLHVTVCYAPKTIPADLLGEPVTVTVTGYGNDGVNEGYAVRLHAENEALQELLSKIEVPHITLSRAKKGRSVDTRYLEFSPVESFTVTGRFGVYEKSLGPLTQIPG